MFSMIHDGYAYMGSTAGYFGFGVLLALRFSPVTFSRVAYGIAFWWTLRF
jgi:hypothetical protein